MAIQPVYANVVVFFGGDSCERLASMLRYMSLTLGDSGWQRFLFVLATPGPMGVAQLPQDIPKEARERCRNGSGDENSIIYRETAEAIHGMYSDGRFNLHLICDDFASGVFSPQAPAKLVEILRGATGLDPAVYFYLCLQKDEQAVSRQHDLAARLCEDSALSHALVYLLSKERDDNSLTSRETIWRALTCEILTVSANVHRVVPSRVCSLGYVSLNADEKELYNLRRQHLLEYIREQCGQSYPETQAWLDLLGTEAPDYPVGDTELREALRSWLLARIEQDLPKMTSAQLDNFRILSGALRFKEPGDLFQFAERFFKLNLHSPNASQERAEPQHVSAQKYLLALMRRLCARPNLADFPGIVLKRMLDALWVLHNERSVRMAPMYPQKGLLQARASYMQSCAALAEKEARRQLKEALVCNYALAYGEMFAYVQKLLKNSAPIRAVLDSLSIPVNLFRQLQEKYPSYNEDIANRLPQRRAELTKGLRLYLPENAAPDVDGLREFIERGVQLLHEGLRPGFNSGFIDAIRTEFSSAQELPTFFNRYLDNKRRLFYNIYETLGTPSGIIFADSNLEQLDWRQLSSAKVFFVNNDNVERLDFFLLNKPLKEYLTVQACGDRNNLYFGQNESVVLPLPSEGKASFTLPTADERKETVQAEQRPAEAETQTLSLVKTLEKWLLKWHWAPQIPFYDVVVNGEHIPVALEQYSVLQGLDISAKLVPGRNAVALCALNGRVLASQEFGGPRVPVEYRKESAALHLFCPSRFIDQLVVCERTRGEDGGERCVYYPLGAPEKDFDNLPLVYKGLSFRGAWEVVCCPEERFPLCEPKLKTGL